MLEKAGGLKYWFSFGAAGLVAGHLLIFELPAQRRDANEREQRAAIREDARSEKVERTREVGIAHGERAIAVLSEKMERIADSVDTQTQTLIEVQSITHKNQERLIQASEKKLKDGP